MEKVGLDTHSLFHRHKRHTSEFICNKKPFKMVLQSPKLEYSIGEPIPFSVSFSNPKLCQILCLSVKLVRLCTYSSKGLEASVPEIIEIFVGKKSQAQELTICGIFSGRKVNVVSCSGPNLKIRYYIKVYYEHYIL